MTLISYRGRAVAIAGRERFYLAPQIAQRPDGDPLKTFVCYLALYARDVLCGRLGDEPSRYLPDRAERYARECLLAPRAFLAHAHRTDAELAERFNVPLEQIAARRAELAADRRGRSRARRPRCEPAAGRDSDRAMSPPPASAHERSRAPAAAADPSTAGELDGSQQCPACDGHARPCPQCVTAAGDPRPEDSAAGSLGPDATGRADVEATWTCACGRVYGTYRAGRATGFVMQAPGRRQVYECVRCGRDLARTHRLTDHGQQLALADASPQLLSDASPDALGDTSAAAAADTSAPTADTSRPGPTDASRGSSGDASRRDPVDASPPGAHDGSRACA